MFEITLNGEKTEVQEDSSVLDLLRKEDIGPEKVAVEVNENILKTEEYAGHKIKEGDNIEVVYFMGGGIVIQN